jgi:hypothetical protein
MAVCIPMNEACRRGFDRFVGVVFYARFMRFGSVPCCEGS